MIIGVLESIPFAIVTTGALVGVAASLLGTFLVLRGTSMLSDAIGHSIVFGIVVVWLATRQQSGPMQILGAALTGVLTVFLTELLAGTRRVKRDAAIGLVFPVLFSIGVLLLNLYARDVHIDTHTVLLGEIGFVWLDTVAVGGLEVPRALLWMGVVTLVNLVFVTSFYKELKLTTFDPALAASLGFLPGVLFYALLMLTSVTAVAAFDAVGAVLFIAFVIVPPSTGYLLTDRLWRMIAYGSLASILASVLGYALARVWNVSIGGTMALTAGGLLLLAFLFGPRYGLLAQEVRRRDQRRTNEERILVAYLDEHGSAAGTTRQEMARAARGGLRWPDGKVRAVLERCIAAGLVGSEGGGLALTPEGRDLARETVGPARGATESPSGPARVPPPPS